MASPWTQSGTSDESLASKEDSPLKLSTWGAMTLAQVDKQIVEIPMDTFTGLIPGHDLSSEQLKTLPKFGFLKTLSNEHQKYNPLCAVFDAVEELAGTTNRWKNIAHLKEDDHIDHRPDIGSYCEALENARLAYMDAVKPLKRKRPPPGSPTARKAKSNKRPKLQLEATSASDAQNAASDDDDDYEDFGEDGDDDYVPPGGELIHDPYRARTAWAWLVSFLELKDDEKISGFHFQPAHDSAGNALVLRDGDEAMASRAQFTKYFTEAMLRQHRTHFYAFYIAETWVRVFRWDRVGCVVSPAIDLLEDPGTFYNILFRLAHWNAWGFDETAVLAPEVDVQKLEAYSNTNEYLQHYRDMIMEYRAFYPIYKISCPVVTMDGSSTHGAYKEYLVGRHIWGHYAPVGRCTRGYIAFDLETRELAFFKDQWRCADRIRTELETYKRLHRHKVPRIALPVAGGDVSHHRTMTQDYLTHIPKDQRPSARIHTRLVTKQVGLMLETYRDSVELLEIMSHAVRAHWQAWEKAGVLHRDVSAGNIMIDAVTGDGFLNDWDLAKYKEDMENLVPAVEPAGISGTIPFKSALALLYPRKPPEVADDIESFVQVVAFMGMRFHWHNYSPHDRKVPATREERNAFNNANSDLAAWTNNYFFQVEIAGPGIVKGGRAKLMAIQCKTFPVRFDLHKGKKPFIDIFLTEALALLNRHYSELDFEDYAAYEVKPGDHARPDEGDKPMEELREARTDDIAQLPRGAGIVTWDGDDSDPTPPTSAAGAPRRPTGERVRLDHGSLSDIFWAMFYDRNGKRRNVSSYSGDKAFDHFVHQGIITYLPRKNDSGMRTAAQAPNARKKWPRERNGFRCPGRTGVMVSGSTAEAQPQAHVGEAAEDHARPRTRSMAKPLEVLHALDELDEETQHEETPPVRSKKGKGAAKGNAKDKPQGEVPAVRKSGGASASKPKATAPKRRAARKGSPPPKEDSRSKAATKASKSRKAEATRQPSSPRKAAPATKAKVTGKASAAPRAAAVRAGRAGKPPSLGAEMPKAAPTRRSSRLAAQKSAGKK